MRVMIFWVNHTATVRVAFRACPKSQPNAKKKNLAFFVIYLDLEWQGVLVITKHYVKTRNLKSSISFELKHFCQCFSVPEKCFLVQSKCFFKLTKTTKLPRDLSIEISFIQIPKYRLNQFLLDPFHIYFGIIWYMWCSDGKFCYTRLTFLYI